MRALSSTGWTSGAATYDSGFETHNLDRPAPRCSALLSGLVEVIPHLVPSPVAFSTSQPPRRFRVHSKLPKPRDLQHNHARYDALGRWVERKFANGTYDQGVYAPGAGPELFIAATGALRTAYVPLSGQAYASYNTSGLAWYQHSDWLGTGRLFSSTTRTVVNDFAVAPYMEQYINAAGTDTFFTGVGQSAEAADLKNFPARLYQTTQGRWITPDPAGHKAVDLKNPQTLNRYAYVGGDPLSRTDPTGTHLVDCVWDGCGWLHSGGGGGGGGVIDGAEQTVFDTSGLGSNALAACPNNFCSGWVGNSTGGGNYVQYSADANGQGAYTSLATAPAPMTVADKVYQAFSLAHANGNSSDTTQSVISRLVGFTYNAQIPGDQFNGAAAEFGTQDPDWANGANHPGANGSYYVSTSALGLFGMDVQHVADLTAGVEAHYDTFGPANPLHWFGEWLPSLFINTRAAAVQGSRTYSQWTCTVGVGCGHP